MPHTTPRLDHIFLVCPRHLTLAPDFSLPPDPSGRDPSNPRGSPLLKTHPVPTRKLAHPRVQEHSSQSPAGGHSPHVPRQMSGYHVCASIPRDVTQLSRGRHSDTRYSRDQLLEPHAVWKKPDTKGYML